MNTKHIIEKDRNTEPVNISINRDYNEVRISRTLSDGSIREVCMNIREAQEISKILFALI